MSSRREPVSSDEIRRLIRACKCDTSLLGRRDAALAYLVAAMAVPGPTVATLRLRDVRNGQIRLPDQDMEVSLPLEGERLVEEWVTARGADPGPLFVPLGRANAPMLRPLSRTAIDSALARRCGQARIPPFSGHDIAQTQAALIRGQWGRQGANPLDRGGARVTPLASEPDPFIVRYLRRLSSVRRRYAIQLLTSFARLLEPAASALTTRWAEIPETEFLRAVRCAASSHSTRTLNAIRRAVNAVLWQAYASGKISSEKYHMLQAAPWIHRRIGSHGEQTPLDDAAVLIGACEKDASARGARDAALIALIWTLGLSTSEVISLEPLALDRLPATIEPQCRQVLERWREARGRGSGPLLLSIAANGKVLPRAMTRGAVIKVVKSRSREAGLGPLVPEALRAWGLRRLRARLGHLPLMPILLLAFSSPLWQLMTMFEDWAN